MTKSTEVGLSGELQKINKISKNLAKLRPPYPLQATPRAVQVDWLVELPNAQAATTAMAVSWLSGAMSTAKTIAAPMSAPAIRVLLAPRAVPRMMG